MTTIQISPDTLLNFKRSSHEGYIIYEFNFHHPKIRDADTVLKGLLDKYYAKCIDIIQTLYGINCEGEIPFELAGKSGSENDEKP